MEHFDYYSNFRHGSSEWASRRQLKPLYNNQGVFLSLCPFTKKPMFFNSDSPLTLIGGAGSGKGTTMITYMGYFNSRSMLVNDPKGELSAMMMKLQKASGKEVYCINPTALHTTPPFNLPQHRVNVFDLLKPDCPQLVSNIQRIAAMIHETTEAKTYFPKKAQQWDAGLLTAYILTQKKPTLTGYVQFLNLLETEYPTFKSIALGLFCELGNDDVARVMKEITNKHDQAPEEYSGILSTIYSDYGFMSDPQLKNLFSGSDFSLDALSKTNPPAIVYIAFPAENLGIWNKALRLIIGVAMLYQYRNHKSRPVFLIDEAAQLGKFEELEKSITYGRSFYQTIAVFQDIGQISNNYGQAGVQTFLGSSQGKIFIGIRDYETAKLVSDMLGDQTIEVENPMYTARARQGQQAAINKMLFGGGDPVQVGMELGHWSRESKHRDKVKRPLLTPEEILALPEDKSIVFLSGMGINPILGKRLPYFKNKDIAKDFMPNPYFL